MICGISLINGIMESLGGSWVFNVPTGTLPVISVLGGSLDLVSTVRSTLTGDISSYISIVTLFVTQFLSPMNL